MTASPYDNEAFFHQLLQKAVAAGASDVHIKVGQPPGARVRGDMVYFRVDRVSPADSEAVARHLLKGLNPPRNLDDVREVDSADARDRKSTRLNSSHWITSRMPSSA